MEILACPHCHRLFHTSQAVLGKKIRCRGCRQIFHVPKDTTNVPLGPTAHAATELGREPPLAIPCVKNGLDARRCPGCGREFLMKPAFAGKTIRCRGCKAPFRVAAAERTIEKPAREAAERVLAPPPRPLQPGREHAEKPKPASVTNMPRPTIFEDIGDVLEDILPGERVASVIRPKNAATLARPELESVGSLIAIVFGGACALPATQMILWWGFGKDPLGIAQLLPGFLQWTAPQRFWN